MKKKMNKDFVKNETALKLKELGYNRTGFIRLNRSGNYKHNFTSTSHGSDKIEIDKYNDDAIIPTYQQVFDWFREEHNIWINPSMILYNRKPIKVHFDVTWVKPGISFNTKSTGNFDDFYEAREVALGFALEFLENKTQS